MRFDRVIIGRGHTEISLLWNGGDFKGTAGAPSPFVFVIGQEKDGSLLAPRLACRGWDRIGDGEFGLLNHSAGHCLARG